MPVSRATALALLLTLSSNLAAQGPVWYREKTDPSAYAAALATADDAALDVYTREAIDSVRQPELHVAHLNALFTQLEKRSPRRALIALAQLQLKTQDSASFLQEGLVARWKTQPPDQLWADLPFFLSPSAQPPLLHETLTAALETTTAKSPASLPARLDQAASTALRRPLLEAVAQFPWSREQRPAISRWLAPFAPAPEHREALATYTLLSARTNPVETYRWLYDLPPGLTRHHCLTRLFHLIGAAYPRLGLTWLNQEKTRHDLNPAAAPTTAWPATTLARDIVAAYAQGLIEKQPQEGPLHYLRAVTDPVYAPLFEEELLRALRPHYPDLAWSLHQQLHAAPPPTPAP